MGALTLKPFVYEARSWELTKSHVVNYHRATPRESPELLLQLRGNLQVLRVSSVDWLSDRIRFIVDGFRRQRITFPWVSGITSWSIAWSVWWVLVVHHLCWWRCDGWMVNHAVSHRLYQLFEAGRRRCLVSFDVPVNASVYHGVYGLAGVANAGVIFPGAHPYENDKVVQPPLGVTTWVDWSLVLVNMINTVNLTLVTHYSSKMKFSFYRQVTQLKRSWTWGSSAVFQVSPMQYILLNVE